MKILELKKETSFNHLNLFSLRYTDTRGKEKSWIFASRRETPQVLAEIEKRSVIDSVEYIDSIATHEGADKPWDPAVPDAVVIVPLHRSSNRLVIIKEFRVPLGGYQYGFPAGLVDRGESTKDAAKRELWEETGLTMSKVYRQSPPVYSSSGMTDESVTLVYGECEGEPSTDSNEASEDIEVLMLTPGEASSLLTDPDLKFDIKTWIIVSMFADSGRI